MEYKLVLFMDIINTSNQSLDTTFYLFEISGKMIYQRKNIQEQNLKNVSNNNYILIAKNGDHIKSAILIKE